MSVKIHLLECVLVIFVHVL